MGLATTYAGSYLVWERLKTTVSTEQRASTSGTWYTCSHTTGACRFMFMTRAAAQTLANLLVTDSPGAITVANGTFNEGNSYIERITFGPDGVSTSKVTKWTVEPQRRSDGVGFDVAVNIDYDEIVAVGGGS